MGQFGDVFRISLREHRPAEYARLQASDLLEAEVADAEARGHQVFEGARAALLKEDPVPGGYLERVQHLQILENAARELALDDVVVRPDPI